MSDPFLIEGPAVVSFSGGRTSGLMLRRILDAGLQSDVHVLFSNTGKEREETLAFVHECQVQWGVPVRWLERTREEGERAGFLEVDFATASREGEPFAQLIAERKFLPNPVMRYCTQELKIRVMKAFMLAQGYEHWTNVVGLRADEPFRVARMRNPTKTERWDVALPLADAGVSKRDVDAFWQAQPFDLRLSPWEGNCDLCFLKARSKRVRVIQDNPALADWWVDQEQRTGTTFTKDGLSYVALRAAATAQAELFGADRDLADCLCHEGTEEEAA